MSRKANPFSAIDARIAQVGKTLQDANEYIHETAMMILRHAAEHGDGSRAQHLVVACPKSFRRQALVAWFTEFSPIVTRANPADDYVDSKSWKKEDKKYRPFNVAAADKLPFYKMAEMAPEPAMVQRWGADDIFRRLESLIKQIKRKEENKEIVTREASRVSALEERLESFLNAEKKAAENVVKMPTSRTTKARKETEAKAPRRGRTRKAA